MRRFLVLLFLVAGLITSSIGHAQSSCVDESCAGGGASGGSSGSGGGSGGSGGGSGSGAGGSGSGAGSGAGAGSGSGPINQPLDAVKFGPAVLWAVALGILIIGIAMIFRGIYVAKRAVNAAGGGEKPEKPDNFKGEIWEPLPYDEFADDKAHGADYIGDLGHGSTEGRIYDGEFYADDHEYSGQYEQPRQLGNIS